MADVKDTKAAAPAARRLELGQLVWFRGWTEGEEKRPAWVSHFVGTSANLMYLSKSGSPQQASLAPYDASGGTPGSWRFPE